MIPRVLLAWALGGGLLAADAYAQERVRIVVLISADAEWAPTKDSLKPTRVERSPYGEFFTHRVAGEPVLFVHGGWGKVAAAASTEYAISRWHPENLINLGTCGGVAGRVQRYERLLVTRTVIHDIQEAMATPPKPPRPTRRRSISAGSMTPFRCAHAGPCCSQAIGISCRRCSRI